MLEELFEEMIALQVEKLWHLAKKILPHITRDDLFQPNDFPELENNPFFRYEEGVLEGLRSAKMGYIASKSTLAYNNLE